MQRIAVTQIKMVLTMIIVAIHTGEGSDIKY